MFDKVISTISDIIKFDSSLYPPEKGMPFGEGAAKCLGYFLDLAKSFGFETVNYDNYAGEVIFGGNTVKNPDDEFAILAHLDVVPAGRGWAHDPFGGEIDYENKKIWGRGAMDDKGPAVIALYCLKALKDEGFVPSKKIKLIVGCNEENGWECIKYYKAHAYMPDYGFSPDADFPVIYAEKGILHLKLEFPPFKGVIKISGGERTNMVCDYCEAILEGAENSLVSHGKSAHASTPELGVNAIKPVLEALNQREVCDLLFGGGFGFEEFHDETGKLTFSPNIIEGDSRGTYVTCDIRFPATCKKDDVLAKIEAKGVNYEVLNYQAPLFMDRSCELVQTLNCVYNEVCGKHMQPVAIGGGTYARALKCGAAFGPEEEGEESTIHKPDEYITFEKIEKCLKIYKLAISRLCK